MKVFHNFEKSAYADGTYFDKYVTGEFQPKSERVAALFDGIFIPTAQDWENLKQAIMKDGLYHQNRLAVAPNGSISIVSQPVSIGPLPYSNTSKIVVSSRFTVNCSIPLYSPQATTTR